MKKGNHDPAWWTPERRREQGRKVAQGHHRSSRLSWRDVRAIRAAAKRGETIESIALLYGVTFRNVGYIVNNQLWHDPAYTPGVERRCALHDCDVVFQTTRSDKRFCCKAHRRRWQSRVRHGYYARRIQRCALGGRRADTRERARCGCTRCVGLLMALAERPVRQAIGATDKAGLLDPADVYQQASVRIMGAFDRFLGSGIRWEPFVHREAVGICRDALRALGTKKRGGDVVTLRLDQPLGDDGAATLADVVASPGVDPFDELRRAEAAALLGDLTDEQVASMPEDELAGLRARLAAEGFVPSARAA